MPWARLILLLCLCAGSARTAGLAAEAANPAPGSSVAIHALRGVVRSIDLPRLQITVEHQEIPGYMPAMTMPFAVRDPAILANLQAGESVACQLCVTATAAWIQDVRPAGQPAQTLFAPSAAAPARELSAGDFLPDATLVDAGGQTIHLSDFRGQALAITFIYMRCPLPNYCPLMNRNFAAAQDLLVRLAAGERWHFLSITLDAAHDTPAILAAAADAYGADARDWTFVTAPAEQLRQLGRAVGLEFSLSGNQISHNLRTVVLDPAGRIRQIYRGNDWTPQDLAADMRAALRTGSLAASRPPE